MTPPIFTRGQKTKIGGAGRPSEVKTAKRLGGRVTAASGATRGKGDIVLPAWLVEAKSTTHHSITLPLDWLVKIAHEARMTGRQGALTVTFVNGDGSPRKNGAFVLIEEHVWRELTQRDED